MVRNFLGTLVLLLVVTFSFAQKDDNLKRGKELYKSGNYQEALTYLNTYSRSNPNDEDVEVMRMYSYYQTSQFQQAIIVATNALSNISKPSKDIYYILGKSLHRSGLYDEAITAYKTYINKQQNGEKAEEVKKEIIRAWKGKVYIGSPKAVIIENLGKGVNSFRDETTPMVSPNIDNRIYFSSDEKLNDEEANHFKVFATEISKGVWDRRDTLGGILHSNQSVVLQDFSPNGRIAIIKKGPETDMAPFYVDSLDREYPELQKWNLGFIIGEKGDKDFRFINDSTCLFTSTRDGGFGGYDIYVAFKKLGKWKVQNLGDEINSPYDEVAPVLAVDGNTLFFSSNSIESMGGFDIFYSKFGADLDWGKKKNLSHPFNSGADDQEIRWSDDGRTAYFCSNREGGYGGYDLYSALLREPMFDTLLNQRVFIDRKEYDSFQSSFVDGSGSVNEDFEIVPTYFDNLDNMLTTNNRRDLDNLVSMLKSYPHLTVSGFCHTAEKKVDLFDMYYSLQKSEEVVNYLTEKGVPSRKISLTAVGANYPYCSENVNGQNFAPAKKFNNRIDWFVYGADNLPIKVMRNELDIPAVAVIPEGKQFYEDADGLVFRVQYVQMDGLFKGEIAYEYDHPIIIKNYRESYKYCTGETNNFSVIYDTYLNIKEKGFADAKILAFYNGRELTPQDMTPEFLTDHQELKKFLLYLD